MWDSFMFFAIPALVLWGIGAWAGWKGKSAVAYSVTALGLVVFFAYILMMWISLERPPLRTMGETRLWYSFFLPLAGMIVYKRFSSSDDMNGLGRLSKYVFSFSTLMALVFICINIFKPEIHSKTLMPALQSPWFAPHVIVYMFAYSLFGLAALLSVWHLWKGNHYDFENREDVVSDITDELVTIALALLTLSMLMGTLWAKDAWGHYWAWDPKETWAAITWFSYLGYVHLRRMKDVDHRYAYVVLIIAFCLLQMCWWGVNYLPSAQGMSVHTYSMQ